MYIPWKPNPDYRRLLKTLRRQGDPSYVPFWELGPDPEFVSAILGEPALSVHFTESAPGVDRQMREEQLDQNIRFWHHLGSDAIRLGPDGIGLRGMYLLDSEDMAAIQRDRRRWVDERVGIITSWADFERYPWPHPGDADLYPLEYVAKHLPEGMAIVAGIGGILEPVMFLMGYETLSYALYDQPDLVQAMFEKIKEIQLPATRAMVQMDGVVGLWMTDDMGFKTAPLLSPEQLRRFVFPIQKEFAQLAHERGMPFILHACGNLEVVMEDLIEDVGIDAKHSFEDVIEPVESFVARYGRRIAAMGGVDMQILTWGSESQVRTRTRQILEACAPSGAYVLGSGNTLSNYLSVGNVLAMIDEGHRFNAENVS